MKEKFNDTPAEYTSSIGNTTWPPEKASFERKKGVYPKLIDTPEKLLSLLELLSQLTFDTSTRISTRASVVEEALLALIKDDKDNPHLKMIETIIPLRGTNSGLDDCCLIYVGKNKPERMPDQQQLAEQKKLAEEIFSNHQKDLQQQIRSNQRFTMSNLEIRVISEEDRQDPNIQMMYHDLYRIFGWNEEDIKALLSNPNNILVAAFGEDGRLIGSVLGEFGTLTFKKDNRQLNLRVVEITEAAVNPKHRGNGIYQAISNELINTIASIKNPHLVFGELNLESPAVLKVAAKQERIPALHTAEDFGIPHAWVLPQHVPISSGFSHKTGNNYNNLMVAYLTQSKLINFDKKHER